MLILFEHKTNPTGLAMNEEMSPGRLRDKSLALLLASSKWHSKTCYLVVEYCPHDEKPLIDPSSRVLSHPFLKLSVAIIPEYKVLFHLSCLFWQFLSLDGPRC